MIVWTVANQKGGVGKTTTSAALAGLAAEQGRRVLLIDLDPHGSLTSYFGQNPDTVKLSAFTLFAERGKLSRDFVKSVIINSGHQKLDLIPSATALATLERRAVGQGALGLVIGEVLSAVSDDYDLAIIDTPPLLGVLMINALAACHELIIPVQTEYLALKGLERMVNTLNMMAKSNQKQVSYCIVPAMFDRRTQASVSTLRTIRHDYPLQTWPGKVPIDTKFRDASKAGVPPHLFEPQSRGVEAYRSLYKWLVRSKSNKSANTSQKVGVG
ncbi:ParA family protein [Gilvimarinus agarilyticus]|uniref:ParA family protein n=1 Tax=unclassified Gilvimarinus TaxID=2642066 RepID=UPI001C090137|nr:MULTISPECIES: ParA family protein [unclassified Gilvimarinus]MBU2887211.1 ParA family protein [Gilvimarinus agarilyticus]MDO6571870.1 ParA family protein [Gilvimarinus sp. 2_MG-2023]MDO6745939.1 ParA family protein [Gilvimarinus sp. 1_MG-2023]